MLPLDIPPGTTIESLVTEAIPALHARLVAEGGPDGRFAIALRIEGCGSWTIHIRGREMLVDPGEEPRPTIWMYTTKATAQHFLEDARGPKRLLPGVGADRPPAGGVLTLTDPRVIGRVAMANGRIELAVQDEEGRRLVAVFGFGDATRRPIDPHDPNTVVEVPIVTVEHMLSGDCGPEEALANGDVTVRGSRLLAMQLAFAIAPFYPRAR